MKHPRLEFHLSIIHSPVMGSYTVEIRSAIEGHEPQTSSHSIGQGQLFLRVQEHVNNHLRRLCNQVENQPKRKQTT